MWHAQIPSEASIRTTFHLKSALHLVSIPSHIQLFLVNFESPFMQQIECPDAIAEYAFVRVETFAGYVSVRSEILADSTLRNQNSEVYTNTRVLR